MRHPAPVRQQQPGLPQDLLHRLLVLLLGLLHLTACELLALPTWPLSWQQHCDHCVWGRQVPWQAVPPVQLLQEQLPCQARVPLLLLLLLQHLFP
jgi:hypothetical protein